MGGSNEENFKYESCKNAEEAKELFENFNIKCIITDLVMPNEDGISLLKNVMKNHPKTRRALMTGKGDLKSLSRATNEAHVRNILLKPLEEDNFIETVELLVKEYDSGEGEEVLDILFVHHPAAQFLARPPLGNRKQLPDLHGRIHMAVKLVFA